MSVVVVDASVAVKWFVPEPHAPATHRLLVGRWTLMAPELIWVEVANALRKCVQRAELTYEAAEEILRNFKQFPLQTYPIKTLFESAWSLAMQHQVSVYDGLYLALAVSRDCHLVTADRRFHDAIRAGSLAGNIVWVENI